MSKHAIKCKLMYVNHPMDRSKLTWFIHGSGHSSADCKVLNAFGSKYTKDRPSKKRRKDPAFGKSLEKSKLTMMWSSMQLIRSFRKKKKN